MASYDRDYITTLPLLKQRATEFSGGSWNKFDADIGETLLKILASSSHTVDYYFRMYLDNLFLPTDNWSSKNYIWELIGYKPPYIRADYLMIQLYWPDCGLLSYVPVYMYTPFKVIADGKEYEFMAAEDTLIPPMTSRVNIRLVQGSLQTLKLDTTKVKDNMVFLSEDPIDYDLVTLNVSGENWRQVRNVFYEPNTEKIFSLHREQDGIYLRLHKTWTDYVDEYNKTMTVYFVKSDQTFDDYTEDCLSISFAGELLDTSGVDVASFYRIFPLLNTDADTGMQPSTTEGDRAITTADFGERAVLYPGVATAKAYSWNESSLVREPFEVGLVASGPGGALRGRTKEALKAFLQSICSPLLKVRILDPIYQPYTIRVLLDIGDFKDTLAEIQIRLTVKAALEDFFALGNFKPGDTVTRKELNSVIVRSDERIVFAEATVTNVHSYSPRAIPTLGTVVLVTEMEYILLQDGQENTVHEVCDRAIGIFVEEDPIVGRDRISNIDVEDFFREKGNVLEVASLDRDLSLERVVAQDALTIQIIPDGTEWNPKNLASSITIQRPIVSTESELELSIDITTPTILEEPEGETP